MISGCFAAASRAAVSPWGACLRISEILELRLMDPIAKTQERSGKIVIFIHILYIFTGLKMIAGLFVLGL